ncbi:ATP-binding protein [Thalassotalea aquiviva]|uniref:ATP-binding protein n=1 Tax=Thalassotalea aquiviva TaxID=3242415 RepID=UPI00352A59FD
MINIKHIINSITVKMFLGFWLIAIAAILITRWVSFQYMEFNHIAPISTFEQKKIAPIIAKVQTTLHRHRFKPIKSLLKNKKVFPKQIWLQSIQDNTLYTNSQNTRKSRVKYIEGLKLEEPVSIHLPDYHVLGPYQVSHNGMDYRLYLGRPISRHDFGALLNQIPAWLKIVTTLLVTGTLCWALSLALLRPIKRLTQASQAFGAGDFSIRVPEFKTRHDEVGQLGQAFNDMAEHIQQSMNAQQRLLGDISHELRAPLTRLQLALSLAEKIEHNSPELDKYLTRFDIEINRLNVMIEQALQLSKLENQLTALNFSHIDVIAILVDIINDARFSAQSKEIDIDLQLPDQQADGLFMMADQTLLCSAIENIISNAIRYSPKQGMITVKLAIKHKHLILSISDQGPGVDKSQLSQIFKPFYRTQQARDRLSGGTGLGLAIAKHAIESHGGQVRAKLVNPMQEDAPGLNIIITLPLEPKT